MMLSFVIAGVICAAAALAYAEVATMIPASGSAYTYSYVVFGELIAWFVGWSLILEYSLVVSAVSVGWSGYFSPLVGIPEQFATAPMLGGVFNFPADVHHRRSSPACLVYGLRESANLNSACWSRSRCLRSRCSSSSRSAAFNSGLFRAVHALRLRQERTSGAGGRGDGRCGDHLLRLLRLRRDRDCCRGSEEPGARPVDRDRRVDAALRGHLHGGCRRRDRRRALPAIRLRAPSRWRRSCATSASRWRRRCSALSASVGMPTVILAFFYGQSRIFLAMPATACCREARAAVGAPQPCPDHDLHRRC